MQNERLTNFRRWRILDNNIKNALTGKKYPALEFQRAVGWCEGVPGMMQLALEQPPERSVCQ